MEAYITRDVSAVFCVIVELDKSVLNIRFVQMEMKKNVIKESFKFPICFHYWAIFTHGSKNLKYLLPFFRGS